MPSCEDGGMTVNGNSTPFKVLVVGGSYGGMSATLNLLDLCRGRPPRFSGDQSPNISLQMEIPIQVTIVDERDGYYHLIGSPLALASERYAEKAWTKFEEIPALQSANIRYMQGSVIEVSCKRKVAKIEEFATKTKHEEKYDFLVAATGLRRVWPVVPQSLQRSSYLSEAREHIRAVRYARERVVVIGGGAVGIEMATELKMLEPQQKVTLIHSRQRLLSSEPLPDEFRDRVLSLVQEAGVEVVLGQRAMETTTVHTDRGIPLFRLTLSDGSQMVAGHVINATSRSIPTSSYLPEAALDNKGYIKILPTLNFPEYIPNAAYHFAVGDIAKWSGIKRCGGAMHMGHYAAINIHQHMCSLLFRTAPKPIEIQEFPPVMGLAVGKKAACYSPTTGVTYGEDVLEALFRDDLGFTICWDYMKLSQAEAERHDSLTEIKISALEGPQRREEYVELEALQPQEELSAPEHIQPQDELPTLEDLDLEEPPVFKKLEHINNLPNAEELHV